AGVADDVDVRVVDRRHEAFHDLLSRLFEPVVQYGNHPVRFGQNVIAQVHGGVFENVALDAAEDLDAADFRADLLDFLPVRAQPAGVEAVGHRDSLGMVGDRDVL